MRPDVGAVFGLLSHVLATSGLGLAPRSVRWAALALL
jgi:hypothetical protein